jgi:Domain of unknown function (DUF222)/HNH endonuclease
MEHHDDLLPIGDRGDPGDPAAMLASMSDDEVEQALLGLRRHLNVTSIWLHHAVAEYDRRGVAERRYVLTTRQWLRRFCRMSGTTASRVVATARALRHMPHVAKVAAGGDIAPEAIDRLAAAEREHPDDFPLHEPVFADIAARLDTSDLRTALEHWRQQVGGHDVAREAQDRIERRRLSISQTYEGMWHQEGLLDPESGHIVSTALRAIADPPNLDPDDHRSHPQRMVDAAVDICRFWLDHNETVVTSGGTKPHVTITVDYDRLVASSGRLPELDGTPIPPDAMRRLLCDAGVTRVVVDGEGRPLDVGRTVRTATPGIRRALDVRDRGCTWLGCDAPAGWCDAHHIEHWADGGPTSLSNLTLLCRRHHTAVHEGRRSHRWAVSTVPDRRPEPPDP